MEMEERIKRLERLTQLLGLLLVLIVGATSSALSTPDIFQLR
jgi:hypothetical protein